VAVADSFDAMTVSRVYQNAITPEQALQKLQEGSGTQYDPDVIQAFVKVWDKVLDFLK